MISLKYPSSFSVMTFNFEITPEGDFVILFYLTFFTTNFIITQATTDPHDDGNENSSLLNRTTDPNDDVNQVSSERDTTEPTAEKRIEDIAKEKQCSRNDWGKDCKFTKDGDKNWCRMHQICSQYSKLKSKGVAPQESGEQTPSEQCARITGSLSVLMQGHKRLTKTVKEIETLQTNLKSVEVPIDAKTKVEDLQRMAEVYGALQKGCAKMATIQLQIKEGWNRVGAETGAAGTEIPASESAGN